MESPFFIASGQLQALLECLQQQAYRCIGPLVKDGAIVFDTLTTIDQLPQGIHDSQAPGSYTLTQTEDPQYFAWANGPQALKPLLFTPEEHLWRSERSDSGDISFDSCQPPDEKIAIIGARACDVAAMKLQDQHFLQQTFKDPYYERRRENLLVIAVNCSHPADTCFCASTGDGPFVEDDHSGSADIVLTELQHGMLISVGSDQGEQVIEALQQTIKLQAVTAEQLSEADSIKSKASQQTRKLPDGDIHTGLMDALDADAWQRIAAECLSCGNCTAVCPSCFCHSESEAPLLDGSASLHLREWDSCFTAGHSYIHGLTIRADTSQRYRQWLTHKFAGWIDQYSRSGCVGCGRCITWCPVGIDVLESISSVMQEQDGAGHD